LRDGDKTEGEIKEDRKEDEKEKKNIPSLNASGFSEITQCPAWISTICDRGKNVLIAGTICSST
jgi:hypothetical protein